jgi:hypothetical protein
MISMVPLGCGESAAVIEVRADDLSIPVELGSFCLAAWDRDLAGGEFARHYRFDGAALASLPQTLTVEPGDASAALVAARGYRAGIEVARDQKVIDFDGVDDVPLSLARCPAVSPGAPEIAGSASVPGAVALAVSFGRTGAQVIAVGDGVSARLDPATGLAPVGGVPDAPPGAAAVVAFDADGDCDDDVVVVSETAPAQLWRRAADGTFAIAGDGFAGGGPPGRAIAAADIDLDGDIDLAIGDAAGVTVWENAGAGRFALAAGAAATDADDVSALGFGDFDGDGDADLLIGRGRDAPVPARVLLGDGGRLAQVDAAAPPIDLAITSIAVRDLDGDRVDDALLAVDGEPVRVFAGRGDGRLEDRSFLFFPDGPPIAESVAAADWDGDCLADVAAGSASYRGSAGGLIPETTPSFGLASLFADLDGDGDPDLLGLDAAGEIVWVRR